MLSKVRGDTAKQGTHLFAVMTLEFGTPSKKKNKKTLPCGRRWKRNVNSNVSLNFEDTSRSNRVYILSDNFKKFYKERDLNVSSERFDF